MATATQSFNFIGRALVQWIVHGAKWVRNGHSCIIDCTYRHPKITPLARSQLPPFAKLWLMGMLYPRWITPKLTSRIAHTSFANYANNVEIYLHILRIHVCMYVILIYSRMFLRDAQKVNKKQLNLWLWCLGKFRAIINANDQNILCINKPRIYVCTYYIIYGCVCMWVAIFGIIHFASISNM